MRIETSLQTQPLGRLVPSIDARAADMSGRSYNILMIAPTSFFGDYGCHVRILEEARILEQLGNRVTIVTYYKGNDVDGLRIERTIPMPWRADYEVGSSRHKIAFDVLLSLKILSVARRLRPDIVHGHLHEGALLGYSFSLLGKVPLVFDFQGSLTGEMIDHHFLQRDGWAYRPMRWLEETINRLPHAIITSSYHASDLCICDYGCPANRVHTVPDCVNSEVFRPDISSEEERLALKARLGIPLHRRLVVYLGLLADYQGTDLLLEAAKRLLQDQPQTHFLIMGYPGEAIYREKARVMGLGDYCTFTGRIPYDEAPRYLALGDVAVAPKISATEGSGKLLNYMAMALPTAAFATRVSREYLRQDGVYAEVGNPVALAEALASLLADEGHAASIGQRLRRRAIEEYSWERAGRQILEIYDKVVGQSFGDVVR